MGTVSNALNILEYFASVSNEMGLSELARVSGRDKATVYRYLCELESSSFVKQDLQTKKYRLGAAVARLAKAGETETLGLQIIGHVLQSISKETTCLAIFFGVKPVPLQPSLVYECGKIQEFEGKPISEMSGAGVCLHRVMKTEPDKQLWTPEQRRAWTIASDAFEQNGFAERPGASKSGPWSLSAPVFNAAGGLCGILTLSRSAFDSRQGQMKLETAALLGASASTAAIGGVVPQSGSLGAQTTELVQ